MDPGKRPGQHGSAAAEPRLHGRVFPGRALADVLVSDGHPIDTGLVVAAGDLRVGAYLTVGDVQAGAHLARVGVDHPEVQVPRDVLQVSPVGQPRSGHRDVVGGALALGLHQHRKIDQIPAVPGRERFEHLQAPAGR